MSTAPSHPILALDKVSIGFRTTRGHINVTSDVSFSIGRGERVGLVGESGCGKSVTGLAILRLLPAAVTSIRGRILFDGTDLAGLSEQRMRAVRGRGIAMIFQEPMSALDPVFTVGSQISEAWIAHFPERAHEAKQRALDALEKVGIPLPAKRYNEFPHQLSGGMRQRVMIAMAIVCEPQLIIADEPTTALDVTVQAQIMELLCALCDRLGTSLLFITHDLGVVSESCHRMLTMYAGQIVEDAQVDTALELPRHPYTSGLLMALPRRAERFGRLASIPGRVPSPSHMPSGCRYRERCGHAKQQCSGEQTLASVGEAHWTRCVRSLELDLPGAVMP